MERLEPRSHKLVYVPDLEIVTVIAVAVKHAAPIVVESLPLVVGTLRRHFLLLLG